MSSSGGFDIISVGDIVTDAFIKLFDDRAHTYKNEKGEFLAIPFGTKIPFESHEVIEAVGNASNAAISFARLGLKTGFVTNVGEDEYGRNMIRTLQRGKVDTRYVRVNPGKKSNYHFVLRYGPERTILINHEEYEYDWPFIKKADKPNWIYFSSVSKNSLEYHDEMAEWLEANPDVKLALQPGTYQMEFGAKRLKKMYQLTEVLLLNREEAVTVGGGDHGNIHDLFDKLHALGPKIVVITDGPKGAYASSPEGRIKMPPYPDPKEPFERTGAGDAFSSTFVAELARGNTVEGAMQLAPINSMSVVQHVGAQRGLLKQEQLEALLRVAPNWYKPEKI